MNGRMVMAGLVLGLSLGSTTLAARMVLDPGIIERGTVNAATTDLIVAPGTCARLDMLLGDDHIEVMTGQVNVVLKDGQRTWAEGQSRVVPAGTAFELLNLGADPVHLKISVVTRVGNRR